MKKSPAPLESKTVSLHGVFLEVLGIGALLTGTSGIGKSELALGLINRGHCLIADDAVDIKRKQDTLVGHCPPLLQDFLEVRGLGILNIRAMFGDSAIKQHKRLQLIVNLFSVSPEDVIHIDRLHGMHEVRSILDVAIPEVSLPVAPGRNMSVLIEAAVRNHVLKEQGYYASELFQERQLAYMQENRQDK